MGGACTILADHPEDAARPLAKLRLRFQPDFHHCLPAERAGNLVEQLTGVAYRALFDPGVLGRLADGATRPGHPARPVVRRDRVEPPRALVEPLDARIDRKNPWRGEPDAKSPRRLLDVYGKSALQV